MLTEAVEIEPIVLISPSIDPDLVKNRAAAILNIDPRNPDDFPKAPSDSIDKSFNKTWIDGQEYKIISTEVKRPGSPVARLDRYELDLQYAWDREIPKDIPIATYSIRGAIDNEVITLSTTRYESGFESLVIKRNGGVIDQESTPETYFELIKEVFHLRG